MSEKHFYITTPIYYVNDKPHIGHAYTSVACDVLARFKRLDGYNVKFLTGTDEHGQKVEKSAKAAGMTPQALADQNSQHFRDLATLMNISNDDFIRTTEPRHVASAQGLWKKMQDEGHIYLDKYAGWYAVRDEAYYQKEELRFVNNAGQTLQFTNDDGGALNFVTNMPDQSRDDGKYIAPTGAEVEWVEEPSYFFRLSAFGEKLLEHYGANPDFIGPESRRNEVISFVKGGLKDLSISRTTFSWGIKVPGDEKHVMYVWLDALANYLSALGYPDVNAADLKTFWPADLHMVGKDIIRFHAVYWPAFLMAAKLPLPKRVFAHGWWTIEGEKMSKSLGNAVAPQALVDEFGLDQTRWFLMREVPFGNDGNFSREAMINRINSELANNIGNLVQRTLSMIHKNCGGVIPSNGKINDSEKITANGILFVYSPAIDQCQFGAAANFIVITAQEANSYIDQQAPWKLKKDDPARMDAVLYVLLNYIRIIAVLLQPFMPDSSSKILDLLSIPQDQRTFAHLSEKFALVPGTPLPPPQPVFPRFMEKAA